MHRIYTTKFHNLLKVSQTIQQEFKNSLQSRVITQIRVFKQDITDEELDKMKDDPEAGLKLMMAQVMGPAHPKLQ